MSAEEDGDDGPGRREVAHRLFAAEFEDADLQYSESDEERAPNYVVTPSGARVNRMFFVGVLTELEQVNESMLRARIVDPTGAFVAYAGQYQPDELAFLERVEPPAFLAVTGKARTFQPEDSDRVFTSVRPESINEVDAPTRDRWVVDAARRTVERVEVASRAIESGLAGDALRASLTDEGVDPSLASGVALALDHYGTTPAYLAALRETALDAARVVADEIEEVDGLSVAPDEGGDASVPDRPAGARADAGESGRSSASAAAEAGDGAGGSRTDGTPDTRSTDADVATVDEPEPDTGPDVGAADPDAGGAPEPASTVDAEAGSDDATDEVGDFDVGEFDASGDAGAADSSGGDADLGGGGESFDPDEEVLDPDEREQIESEYGTDFSTAGDVEAEPDAAPEPEPEPASDPDAGPDAEATGSGRTAEPSGSSESIEASEPSASPGPTDSAEPADPADSTDPTAAPGAADATAEGAADPGTDETAAGDGPASGETESGEAAADAGTEPADGGEDGEEAAEETEAEDEPDAEPVDVETAVLEVIEALDDGDGADRGAVAARVADEHGVSESAAEDAIEEAMMSGRCYEPADGRVKSI